MSPAEGNTLPYQPGCVTNPGSPELMSAAKSRYKPIKTTKCDQILLPALPKADLQVKYARVYVCVCVCVYVRVCVCECTCVCVYECVYECYGLIIFDCTISSGFLLLMILTSHCHQ